MNPCLNNFYQTSVNYAYPASYPFEGIRFNDLTYLL